MAFTSTRIARVPLGGGYWMAFGRFTQLKTETGGNIDTGLRLVYDIWFTPRTTGVANSSVVVNVAIQSGPVAGNAVTIVTSANLDGTWTAIGKK